MNFAEMDNYLEGMEFLLECGVILAGLILMDELDEEISRKRQRYRVNPYLSLRSTRGRFTTDFEQLKHSPGLFFENFRMSPDLFEELFQLVEPHIRRKRNSRPNDFIPEKAKLAIVLEFMASGDLQRHISSCYRISKQHLSTIISKVCNAISTVLKDEVPIWNEETLKEKACEFEQKWNFPNCVGAIDGKHIQIRAPPRSGSIFYNYKGFHSVVLLAVCDADYKFTYLDVGAYGSEGNSGIFMESKFGMSIMKDTCRFPPDAFVGDIKLPYFLVGDDAFPQSKRIMKPFSKKALSKEERIFNYRLSRVRRCIENAFGVLVARWSCLRKVLFCSPSNARSITTACCLLHNFLMNRSRHTYCPEVFTGSEIDGLWMAGELQISTIDDNLSLVSRHGRTSDYAKHIRNTLKNYVNSPEGSVPWQHKAAFV